VAGDRLVRILARLSPDGETMPTIERVCETCEEVVGVSGAGLMLMSGNTPQGSISPTNDVSALIEELQFTLGEGPCIDAYHDNLPVLEPDLADPDMARWPAFTPAALDGGVRAIFGFPLDVGAVRIGALNLYRDDRGPLTEDQYADALVLSGLAARTVLGMQANALPGTLGVALEDEANFRFVVHQATGMVAAQLEVSLSEALLRLRAYAFANARLVTEVSHDVVARKLRFDGAEPNGR
jgi:hypothetical protein